MKRTVRMWATAATAALVATVAGWAAPASAAEPAYVMQPGSANLCVEPAGGSAATGVAIEQVRCNPARDTQWWEFLPSGNYRFTDAQGEDFYNLIAKHSFKCLNVPRSSTVSGTDLITWDPA